MIVCAQPTLRLVRTVRVMLLARRLAPALLLGASAVGTGCSPVLPAPSAPPRAPATSVPAASDRPHRGPDLARARAMGRKPLFAWQPYSKDVFAQARSEGKLVLVDGAAAWCHWCHVMDETTYLDPAVGKLIAERFVAVRFDADAAPDLAERYGAWGWPATIVLSADAVELGKFRGYLPPEEMLEKLLGATATGVGRAAALARRLDAADRPARASELGWVVATALHQLDEYWDDAEAGWGRRQKAPIGEAIEVELARAEHGDEAARARALRTIEKQRALYDPVWGGVYQYSAAAHWNAPHFEKLATYQAANIAALSRAARLTHRTDVLADALAIRRYVDAFLSSPEGAFYTSQDADLGGHDASGALDARAGRFVDGHDYYPLDDAHRRALGVPRVDTAEHPHENGLLIAAYVALAAAAPGSDALARAERAAERLALRVDARGVVSRDGGRAVLFLADYAGAAFGFARLAEASKSPRFADLSRRIALRMLEDFAGAPGGGLYAATLDPDAAGVFAERLIALPPSVLAARALAAVARGSGERHFVDAGRAVLAGAATPRAISEQGRMVGGFILAASELGLLGGDEAGAPGVRPRP